MANKIPDKYRRLVWERDQGQCVRCGAGATDWHHRRRRNVKNGHFQHCLCVGVATCAVCHRQIHSAPKKSMSDGFIVSSYEGEPWTVPLKSIYGWMLMDCEGNVQLVDAPEQ